MSKPVVSVVTSAALQGSMGGVQEPRRGNLQDRRGREGRIDHHGITWSRHVQAGLHGKRQRVHNSQLRTSMSRCSIGGKINNHTIPDRRTLYGTGTKR